MQNSYRFLLQPFLQAEFVCIGDAGIMIAENIVDKHVQYFRLVVLVMVLFVLGLSVSRVFILLVMSTFTPW